jgi:hypothetical protein
MQTAMHVPRLWYLQYFGVPPHTLKSAMWPGRRRGDLSIAIRQRATLALDEIA